MRLVELAVSAVIGGAIGFAASLYVAGDGHDAAEVAALVDARVDARLDALGLEGESALDSRISGGVAQFLADQPEAVLTALEQHQTNEAAREAEALRQTVTELGDRLTAAPEDPAIGADAATADITLIEFFDYRCGYCRRSLDAVLTLAEEDPRLRVVLKEFPILGPESVAATQVSLAANRVDPKKYAALHEALMNHPGPYDTATLLGVAAEAGYDPAAVQSAMGDDDIRAQIRDGYQLAEALGIRGTPAFVVGDQVIPGAVSAQTLREAIETARGAAKQRREGGGAAEKG